MSGEDLRAEWTKARSQSRPEAWLGMDTAATIVAEDLRLGRAYDFEDGNSKCEGLFGVFEYSLKPNNI